MPSLIYKTTPGQRFGKLTALHPTNRRSHKLIVWEFKCDCGKKVMRPPKWIRRKGIASCGCAMPEIHTKHGGCLNGKADRLYRAWRGLLNRCLLLTDKNYKNYGGRGISVYPEWVDNFPAFQYYVITTLGTPRTKDTLDRINSDGDYIPGNIRWASYRTQAINRKKYRSKNTSSKYKGVYFYKQTKKWKAKIGFNGKSIDLGQYSREIDAALAYNKAAIQYYGTIAPLNEI